MPSRDHHSISDERLRQRYEELRALRETQPEKEATAARKALDKSREASDLLARSSGACQTPTESQLQELRAENAALRGQLAESPPPPPPPPPPILGVGFSPPLSSALEAKLEF